MLDFSECVIVIVIVNSRRAGLAVGGLAREDPGPGGQEVVSGAEGAVLRMTASGRAVGVDVRDKCADD